jgi:hypothetical protein
MSIELSVTALNDEKPCNLYSRNENGDAINKINSFSETYKHKVDKNYNSKYLAKLPDDNFSTMEELLKGTANTRMTSKLERFDLTCPLFLSDCRYQTSFYP